MPKEKQASLNSGKYKQIICDVNTLTPYVHNNRKHPASQIKTIRNSIKEFDFNQPILIDENNEIIAGHGRLIAAKEAGLKTVPCFQYTDLTEVQKRKLRVVDNESASQSERDLDNLMLELDYLEAEGVALDDYGLEDLKILLPDEEPEVTEDDFEVEEPDETFIKMGDIIELNEHRVMCGDSTKAEDVAELMDGQQAAIMFTDPPYGVNYEGGHFNKRKREKLAGDETTQIYSDFLPVALSVVDGPCYMWFSDSKVRGVYNAVHEADCEIHALIIWHKTNAKYAAMNAQYKQRHEPCLYFKPKGSTLRWCGKTTEATVWNQDRDGINEFHPTQKPIALAAKALGNHEAKTVFDPFLGSGTTLIAADQLNRICYGMEISPKYCHVIIERFKAYCEKAGKECVVKVNGSVLHHGKEETS